MSKVFKDVTVLIADGKEDDSGHLHLPDNVRWVDGQVIVTKEFGSIIGKTESDKAESVIGKAELRKDGNLILADLTINDDKYISVIEKGNSYPCVGGKTEKGYSKNGLLNIEINTIGIFHYQANIDKRIPAIVDKAGKV